MNINGTVLACNKEFKTSKAGKPFTVHSIQLDTGQVVETGFKQPYSVGQTVNLEVEQKYGKWQVVATGSSLGGAPTTAGSAPPVMQPSKPAFPVALDSRETSICRQSALKAAVDLVMGGMKAPYQVTPEMIEQVIAVAYEFCDFSTGNREVKMVAGGVGK